MHRRTLFLGTAGLTAGWLLQTKLARAQAPSAEVLRFVRDTQEREYNDLADALGGGTATSVHARIASRRMAPDLQRQYASVTLPTPFEDPYMYPIMTTTLDAMSRETDQLRAPALPRPVLATLPSGDVDARVTAARGTNVPVVFFEQGLFSYFYDTAKIMAWAAPPLTERELTDDGALVAKFAQSRRVQTMPFTASESFAASLYAYARSGSPVAESTPIPEPEHNLGLSIRLLNHMVRFAMAHELAHIREGHLNQTPSKDLEFNADSLGVSLVTTLADRHHGSWAVGYWGSELVLVALNLLYRAIGLLTIGPSKLAWISQTHPDPLLRRENMRGIWLNPGSPKAGVAAARDVSGMMESTLQRLWEISLPVFLTSYQRGERASPRWKKTAARFRAAQ